MALVSEGPLAGNYLPDYDGGSTVNLLASIIRSRGGHSPHPVLTNLPIDALATARSVVYLVVDGLGYDQLHRHLARGQGAAFFARHEHRAISTVFPATTAAAVTTFDSGASPAEHAILSWYLHLPDLGVVSTVLRTTTRLGTPLFPDGYDLADYYRVPSYVATIPQRLALLSWGEIPHLPFAAVGTQWHDRTSYADLEGMIAAATSFARDGIGGLAYAYWPRYDALCHEFGCAAPEVDAHFDEIDDALARMHSQLAGTETVLCVLADHGLVDVTRERCIDITTIPGLMDCLAVAPSGDQRQLSMFVRPARVPRFLALVSDHLAHACVCIAGEHLLEIGAFGPGKPHPQLRNRIGDYVLMARDDYALGHTPPGLEPVYMPGSHGGMSSAEIRIPLYVVG